MVHDPVRAAITQACGRIYKSISIAKKELTYVVKTDPRMGAHSTGQQYAKGLAKHAVRDRFGEQEIKGCRET